MTSADARGRSSIWLRLRRSTCDRSRCDIRIRFYEGHLASFNLGMLLQSGFVENDPQSELTTLFARGIDPLDTSAADKLTIQRWPEREVVADYITRVENEMARAFEAELIRFISTRPSNMRRCIRRH